MFGDTTVNDYKASNKSINIDSHIGSATCKQKAKLNMSSHHEIQSYGIKDHNRNFEILSLSKCQSEKKGFKNEH